MNKDFKYEIKEHIGTVSSANGGRFALEVNLISYNDTPAKVDVRRWDRDTDKMLKGITMTREEAQILGQILLGMDQKGEADDRETETIC